MSSTVLQALVAQLSVLEVEKAKPNISGRFEEVLRDLWQKNGDQCSVIYAGTGALEGKSKVLTAFGREFYLNLAERRKPVYSENYPEQLDGLRQTGIVRPAALGKNVCQSRV